MSQKLFLPTYAKLSIVSDLIIAKLSAYGFNFFGQKVSTELLVQYKSREQKKMCISQEKKSFLVFHSVLFGATFFEYL